MTLDVAMQLQAHEGRILRRYREWLASDLRAEADDYEMRALHEDCSNVKELEWIALGFRAAAAKVDPNL